MHRRSLRALLGVALIAASVHVAGPAQAAVPVATTIRSRRRQGIRTIDVLANDTDADNDDLELVDYTDPENDGLAGCEPTGECFTHRRTTAANTPTRSSTRSWTRTTIPTSES